MEKEHTQMRRATQSLEINVLHSHVTLFWKISNISFFSAEEILNIKGQKRLRKLNLRQSFRECH